MIYVLDASALLAVLKKEHGYTLVVPLLPGSLMSTVNLSEVIQKIDQAGLPRLDLISRFEGLGIEMVLFTIEQAKLAAHLWQQTRHVGLSLGDRACLALTQSRGGVAITADQSWSNVSHIQIMVVR